VSQYAFSTSYLGSKKIAVGGQTLTCAIRRSGIRGPRLVPHHQLWVQLVGARRVAGRAALCPPQGLAPWAWAPLGLMARGLG
jgi:hypothetical protein